MIVKNLLSILFFNVNILYTCLFTAQELFSYMSFIHIFCNKSKKAQKLD